MADCLPETSHSSSQTRANLAMVAASRQKRAFRFVARIALERVLKLLTAQTRRQGYRSLCELLVDP